MIFPFLSHIRNFVKTIPSLPSCLCPQTQKQETTEQYKTISWLLVDWLGKDQISWAQSDSLDIPLGPGCSVNISQEVPKDVTLIVVITKNLSRDKELKGEHHWFWNKSNTSATGCTSHFLWSLGLLPGCWWICSQMVTYHKSTARSFIF